MVYGDAEARPGKVLYAGKFRGMNYFVLNKGGEHPCGYVQEMVLAASYAYLADVAVRRGYRHDLHSLGLVTLRTWTGML